ncbi:MAG: hypothetical protein H7338_07370 [Candidatus Sericytochromatia bacterium]|nr:hypothetical protein [Candidatus Sericytochromatia bacterium]
MSGKVEAIEELGGGKSTGDRANDAMKAMEYMKAQREQANLANNNRQLQKLNQGADLHQQALKQHEEGLGSVASFTAAPTAKVPTVSLAFDFSAAAAPAITGGVGAVPTSPVAAAPVRIEHQVITQTETVHADVIESMGQSIDTNDVVRSDALTTARDVGGTKPGPGAKKAQGEGEATSIDATVSSSQHADATWTNNEGARGAATATESTGNEGNSQDFSGGGQQQQSQP